MLVEWMKMKLMIHIKVNLRDLKTDKNISSRELKTKRICLMILINFSSKK